MADRTKNGTTDQWLRECRYAVEWYERRGGKQLSYWRRALRRAEREVNAADG